MQYLFCDVFSMSKCVLALEVDVFYRVFVGNFFVTNANISPNFFKSIISEFSNIPVSLHSKLKSMKIDFEKVKL